MKKMAAGESWILFLRKKENLEKAYYTVEISMKDDRILQYYSEFDRQPDKTAISKVLEKFKQKRETQTSGTNHGTNSKYSIRSKHGIYTDDTR